MSNMARWGRVRLVGFEKDSLGLKKTRWGQMGLIKFK